LLVGLRGVKRCLWRSSSTRFAIPSIQPQHSASSTACDQLITCLPVAFFHMPTQTSVAVSWCASSHAPNAAGDSK
jgi:hypothetical protein